MKRGISVWLMTKVVMLIFLTMTFAVIMSFTGLVQQRSVADSAQHLTSRIKDAIQGLLGIRADTGTRFVVIPEKIPQGAVRSTDYTFHITTAEGNDQEIYIMIAEGLYSSEDEITDYVTASSFELDADSEFRFNLSYSVPEDWSEEEDLVINSSDNGGYGGGRINIMKDRKDFKIYPTK